MPILKSLAPLVREEKEVTGGRTFLTQSIYKNSKLPLASIGTDKSLDPTVYPLETFIYWIFLFYIFCGQK